MAPDYDFEDYLEEPDDHHLEKSEEEREEEIREIEENDPREEMEIVRCCGNCRFFWYGKRTRGRRGYCKLPNPEAKQPVQSQGESYDEDEIKKNWLKTHTTARCEHHQWRAQTYSIEIVSKWIGRGFDSEGEEIDYDNYW